MFFSSLIPFLYPNFWSLIPEAWQILITYPVKMVQPNSWSLKKLLIPIPTHGLWSLISGLWFQIPPLRSPIPHIPSRPCNRVKETTPAMLSCTLQQWKPKVTFNSVFDYGQPGWEWFAPGGCHFQLLPLHWPFLCYRRLISSDEFNPIQTAGRFVTSKPLKL